MNLGDTLRKNTLWLLTGTFGGRILQFLFGIVLARLLLPADFGLLVTVQVFTGVLGYIASGGLGEAIIQAKSLGRHDSHVLFTLQLFVCILLYIGLFFFAPLLSVWFDEEIYTDLLRVSAISFLLRPFANIPNALLRRDMRFKVIAIIGFSSMAVVGVASVLMALQGMGVWSLTLGGLVGPLVSIPAYWWASRWLPKLRFEQRVAKKFGGYGVRASVNEIIVYLRFQTSILMISHQLGPARVALFNKADSLAQLPVLMIGGAAYQTVFRALSSIQTNLDKSIYVYLRSITIVGLYTFPCYVGLFWVAEPFVVTLYGENWRSAGTPLQILAIAGLFRIVANLSGAVIAAQSQLGREIRIQIETWGVLIIGALFGLQWGIIGVTWGVVLSFVYSGLRMYGLAARILGIGWGHLWTALKPVLTMNVILGVALLVASEVLTAVGLDGNDASYLLLMCGIGALVYAGMLLFYPDQTLRSESDRWRSKLIPVLSFAGYKPRRND